MATLGPRQIQRLLDEHGVRPKKSLGQNFLFDANHVARICRVAGVEAGDRVIEIGSGLGSLTQGLLDSGAAVVAIEKDPRLAEITREVAPGAVVVVGDALDQDLYSLTPDGWAPPWKLVANLPYNIATPLLVKVLEEVPEISTGVVMLQLEVARRLVARVGDSDYGAVSLVIQYFADARLAGKVPPSVFLPQPKVFSALVAFERWGEPPVSADQTHLFELIRAGFSKRRKTLRNAIADLPWRDEALVGCERAGVDAGLRAEALSLDQFAAIVDASETTHA